MTVTDPELPRHKRTESGRWKQDNVWQSLKIVFSVVAALVAFAILGVALFDFSYFSTHVWLLVIFLVLAIGPRIVDVLRQLRASRQQRIGNDHQRDQNVLEPDRTRLDYRTIPAGDTDQRLDDRPAAQRSHRLPTSSVLWIAGIAAAVFVVVRLALVGAQTSTGEALFVFVIAILAVFLVFAIGAAILGPRSTRMISAIHRVNPASSLFPIFRSIPLARIIRRTTPHATIESQLVVMTDRNELRIYSGFQNPRAVLTIPTQEIAGVRPALIPDRNGFGRSAIRIELRASSLSDSLVFQPQRAGLLSVIPCGPKHTDTIIQAMRTSLNVSP
jgi:F0F1-type ATP synthase assembly protein I